MSKPEQPTLFLDYDGVLHPDEVYLVRGRPELRARGALFMWAPILEQALAAHPEVRIVLSTSWARELSYTRARRWLPSGLRERVIGATWHSAMSYKRDGFRSLTTWWDEATRNEQIKRYVTRAGLTQWLVVDDQPDGWAEEDRDHLVQTHGETGLSDPAALALLVKGLQSLGTSQAC